MTKGGFSDDDLVSGTASVDKQKVLQIADRLQRKLKDKGDLSHHDKLCILRDTLASPLFNQILTVQQSIKQLKEQVGLVCYVYLETLQSVDAHARKCKVG